MPLSKIFIDYNQYLSNIYGVDYTCGSATRERVGWDYVSAVFCDSIVFWCAVHWEQEKLSSAVGMYMSILRLLLSRHLQVEQFKLFYTGRGKWHAGEDKLVNDIQQREAKESGISWDKYQPGYISLRVSFENISYGELWPKLKKICCKVAKNYILLHDLDISIDCAYISTRDIIKEYITSNGVEDKDIVNDRHSVGDNCLSWRQHDSSSAKIPLRIKIYNKFVQMLESRELRSLIGSQLHHLVSNPDKDFQERLNKYRGNGMTRIEITFYNTQLKKESYYTKTMSRVLEFLDNCPTYKVSFDRQWKQLAKNLTQMAAIYVPKTKTFAYCHWWNSLTKRMQGIIHTKVPEEYVMLHLANFSFNDRPIHYLVVKFEKNSHEYKILEDSIYRREEGCSAITLVPGISNSLTPYRKDLTNKAASFGDLGICSFRNITLEWPKSRLRPERGDKLATIRLAKETHDDKLLQHLDPFPVSGAKPDYSFMKVGVKYQVTGYGYGTFRSKNYLHLRLSNGTSVRCSPGLKQVVEKQLEKHTLFYVCIIRVKKVRGVRDVECEITNV
jgi:hypothetical protein